MLSFLGDSYREIGIFLIVFPIFLRTLHPKEQ